MDKIIQTMNAKNRRTTRIYSRIIRQKKKKNKTYVHDKETLFQTTFWNKVDLEIKQHKRSAWQYKSANNNGHIKGVGCIRGNNKVT